MRIPSSKAAATALHKLVPVASLASLASLAFAIAGAATTTFAFTNDARAQSATDDETMKERARAWVKDGQAALEKNDFKTAVDLYKRAYDVVPNVPTVALGLARALAGDGKVVAATSLYKKIIREGAPPGASEVQKKAVDAAHAEIAAVEAKIAQATLTIVGPEKPKVTLDGAPFPNLALGARGPIDPGAHTLAATADGYKPAQTTFSVEPGATTQATLTMETATAVVAGGPAAGTSPAAAGTATTPPGAGAGPGTPPVGQAAQFPAPPAKDTGGGGGARTGAYVAFGVGGVGLVVGGITGILALGKKSDLSNACPTATNCDPKLQSDLDTYHTMGMLSTVGFITAGVGAAVGAVLLVTSHHPESPRSAWVTPYVGPGTVGAVGRF